MKKISSILSLFLLSILFGGCPYESVVPIDKPSVKVNPALLGTWNDIHNSGDQYKIGKKDDFVYSIAKTSRTDQRVFNYLAFISMVNGTEFVNVYDANPEEESRTYALFKLHPGDKDNLCLEAITENIDEKFSNSGELKKFITANMNSSYFFGKNKLELIRR
jgi:hypothetical protein